MFLPRSRTIRGLLATVAAAALLAACGMPGSAADDEVTTVTFWSWTSGSQELVDRFNATHDDIQVAFEQIPAGTAGGYSKMYNAVRAGKAPDLVNVEYPQVPAFVAHNVIQPLTSRGVEDLRGHYPEWAWNQVALGGEVHALPINMAPQVLLYRADLFAEHGIEPPATWVEFRDAAERINAADPDTVIATLGNTDAGLIAGLAWQAGADWFDTSGGAWEVNSTDDASLEVARYWDGMIRDGLVNAEPVFAEKHIADLQQGRSLALVAAPWMMGNLSRFVPDLQGTWGVAQMPTWDGTPVAGNYGGSTYAVPEGADHPDEALEFARWVATSPEAVAAAAPVSSAMPADIQLYDAWRTALEEANPYVQGMELPEAALAASESVPPDWEWGPDMAQGFTSLMDEMTSAVGQPQGLENALHRWQDTTIEQLRIRGFDVGD
ncbi:ABC transporter substrate-binding protein [Streptomyces litchfieldiae]|uniref:Sugar ABC transporter substrate-binding protein n=1 Tax=Streptomyces litchfieldiae TaxID=3075543 RepID=A0ABU2MMV0_9ACTN|nr:sugar ABC transporter substrate-binding protein [Streptomyces sp. DSM 44938]MDT0342449.1 sugar ABC transporter substrate-binding protein [Streptomyces sp. DSM 44938]